MRVSRHFRLRVRQESLEFVDVDLFGDDPLFVDPRALRTLKTPWTKECVALVQDFFQSVIDAIRARDHDHARRLLLALREPNETHLGLSKGKARGRALGPKSAGDVASALLRSEAIESGLLEDLEETVLLIDGIGSDIVSDMTTNVIRGPLVRFTQEQARRWGIRTRQVDPGPLWDPRSHEWVQRLERLPAPKGNKLLLVPKVIVRKRLEYDAQDYFQHQILSYLVEQEVRANSELVYLLRDGTPRVNKKDVAEKYGRGRRIATRVTRERPELLLEYRKRKNQDRTRPLDHDDLAERAPGIRRPDWDGLLDQVLSVRRGRTGADAYHRAVEHLLTALFHPQLVFPEREVEIHKGRKRIDITYANDGGDGFFGWVSRHHPAMYVIIECKNYTGDPKNPELDQLAGRFSPSRGQLGLLLCRTFDDKDTFIERCRDTANDQRGYVIALDDEDLRLLVEARRDDDLRRLNRFLRRRFDQLVL